MTQDFHFSRIFKGDALDTALARHEHYLTSKLSLKPGMRVLDVGCGHGRAAFELVNFFNVHVVGVDPDSAKIQQAKTTAHKLQMDNRVTFIHANLENLKDSFPAGAFDAIYAIESLKDAVSFQQMYEQFHYLLKPGGKLATYEWCWTALLDPRDADHCRLAELIEQSTFIGSRDVYQRSVDCALNALQTARFDLLEYEDLANRKPGPSNLPWQTPLIRAISDPCMTSWASESRRRGPFGGLTRQAASVLAQAAQFKLFTPMAMFVSQRS